MVFIGHAEYQLTPRWAADPLISGLCLYIHRAGFSGVCLFFTLSSYLITELLLREQEQTGAVHFRSFYVRRILRIWPLYFFFLLLFRPIAARFIPWEHFPGSYLVSYLLLVGNWECLRHGWPASIAAPLWSISIEEQFYLAWPVLIARLRKHLLAVALTMLIVANVSRLVMVLCFPISDPGMWCNTLARLDPFALGAVLAYVLHGRRFDLPVASRVLMTLLGALLLLLTGRFGEHVGERALFYYPFEALACALILLAILLPLGAWKPGLAGRPFVYLGRISYGLYVFHLFYLDLLAPAGLGFFAGKGAALLFTIGTASVSYFALEKPFLRLKQRFTYVHSRV